MEGVKFLVTSIKDIRFFEVYVDNEYLTTIRPVFSGGELIIYIVEKEDDSFIDKLKRIVNPCIDGIRWSKLLDRYEKFLGHLFEEYNNDCSISFSYYNVKEKFEEINPPTTKAKIENWLNNVIQKLSETLEVKHIYSNKEDGCLLFDDLGIYARYINGHILAKIVGFNGGFLAAIVLGALYNGNEKAKNRIDDFLVDNTAIVETYMGARLPKRKDGKWPTPYIFQEKSFF